MSDHPDYRIILADQFRQKLLTAVIFLHTVIKHPRAQPKGERTHLGSQCSPVARKGREVKKKKKSGKTLLESRWAGSRGGIAGRKAGPIGPLPAAWLHLLEVSHLQEQHPAIKQLGGAGILHPEHSTFLTLIWYFSNTPPTDTPPLSLHTRSWLLNINSHSAPGCIQGWAWSLFPQQDLVAMVLCLSPLSRIKSVWLCFNKYHSIICFSLNKVHCDFFHPNNTP